MLTLLKTRKPLTQGFPVTQMIDTVLLDLHKAIITKDLPLFKGGWGRHIWKQTLNPTTKDYLKYGYLPNLTIYRVLHGNRWKLDRLTIQMSVPKVLYGTNFYGVDEQDYLPFVKRLSETLATCGLFIAQGDIEEAVLRSVTFTFSFLLPESFGYPIDWLDKLGNLTIGKRFGKVKKTTFVEKKSGFSIKMYNRQTGFGLYDKRQELINNVKTKEELEVVERMNRGDMPSRILRMELTLQNQQAVKQQLTTRLGGSRKQTRHLQEVFNNQLCKGILQDVFNKLADGVNTKVLEMPLYPLGETHKITSAAGMLPYDADALIGASFAIQQMGLQQFTELQDACYGRQRRAYCHKKYEKLLKIHPLPHFFLGELFEECRKQLADFKIIKSSDFTRQGKNLK